MRIFDEAKSMAYDPFGDDVGGNDRTLSDRIVTARKSGECFMCGGDVRPGTRTRRQSAIVDGRMMTARWCDECCAAMAEVMGRIAGDDSGMDRDGLDPVERRIALLYERRTISDDAVDAAPTT